MGGTRRKFAKNVKNDDFWAPAAQNDVISKNFENVPPHMGGTKNVISKTSPPIWGVTKF